MAYTTQADLELAAGGTARFLELADWDNDNDVDADVLAGAIAAADAFVDGYLRVRYSCPVVNPTRTLVDVAAAHAIWWIKDKRPGGALLEDDVKRLEMRIKTLEQMRAGTILPNDPAPAPSSQQRSAFISNTSDVSRENTKGTIW